MINKNKYISKKRKNVNNNHVLLQTSSVERKGEKEEKEKKIIN